MTGSLVPRIFMTPGYVRLLEPGVYGLFRKVEVEAVDERTGRPGRECAGELGPIGVFREARAGEEVVLESWHPAENRRVLLTRIADA